ncbi:MAG TPA: AraC family transcriptional regulator [Natronosporangium sp.]
MRDWPHLRSMYCYLPGDPAATTRTLPHQVGVSFSQHPKLRYRPGERWRTLAVPSGAVFANGVDEIAWTEVAEPTEALELYPDRDQLAAIVEPAGTGAVEIQPATAARDATVLGLATVIRRIHLRQTSLDPIRESALVHRLLGHLAEHYCRPRPGRRLRHPGRLERRLVDRIADLVEQRLGDPLRLDDLAAVAHLSPYHFARAFKRTTGLAPHEYVTIRRIERAKAMLVSGEQSVATIATALGYGNVAHFRRLFRRYTGHLPSALRPDGSRN